MTDDERNAYRAGGRDFYEFLQEDAPKFSAVNFMKAFAKEMECPESVYEIKHTDIMAAQTQFCIDCAVIAALKAEIDELKSDLAKKAGEIGKAEHRGNTVDYIYDKLENYSRQLGEVGPELAATKAKLEEANARNRQLYDIAKRAYIDIVEDGRWPHEQWGIDAEIVLKKFESRGSNEP